MLVTPGKKLELKLPALATVRLKALGADGLPLTRFWLTFSGGRGCKDREVEVKPLDGVVTVEDLSPDHRSLRLSAPKHVPIEKKVPLAAGKTLDLGTVKFRLAARVSGRVLEADGSPAGHVDVYLGSKEVDWTAEGRFWLTGVAPGPAVLSARDGERVSKPQTVTLRAGVETSVELTLPPARPRVPGLSSEGTRGAAQGTGATHTN